MKYVLWIKGEQCTGVEKIEDGKTEKWDMKRSKEEWRDTK